METRFRQTPHVTSGFSRRERTRQNPWCQPPQQPPLPHPSYLGAGGLMAPHAKTQNLATTASPDIFPLGLHQRPIFLMPPPKAGPSLLCPPVPQPYFSDASFSVGYRIPPTVEPGDLYGGMEHKWKRCFTALFQNLPHVWIFGVCEAEYSEWSVFRDMAKVRFSCQHCGRGWSSMNSSAVFYYAWDADAECGHIRFSLKGQKCKVCKPSHFETPMWYPEEVQKVMTNLYYEVSSRMYGFYTPPMIKNRRHGRPRAHHDSSMCQGCHQKICQATKTDSSFSSLENKK
ncbi:receptor-transporting protein 3-like isoform X1 [Macrobrachium rosenbergii]|uniref:receptor-transporting protein 3-like isoform X1 n=1 Tax=Macrobrachium rosenbergii TaxID=79674 RepID=UPI0034D67121